MMSLRVLRSCRSVSSRILNGICASVCGSGWVAGIASKNTLLGRDEDRVAGDVVDHRGPGQRLAAARNDFDFDAAIHEWRCADGIDRELREAERVERPLDAAERMAGGVEKGESKRLRHVAGVDRTEVRSERCGSF